MSTTTIPLPLGITSTSGGYAVDGVVYSTYAEAYAALTTGHVREAA